MKKTLIAPESLALSLVEVRSHLRIVHTTDDRLLTHLIKTAESIIGEKQGHYGLTRSVEITKALIYDKIRGRGYPLRLYDVYPWVSLPLFPIQHIETVILLLEDGKQKTLEPCRFRWLNDRGPCWPPKLLVKVLEGTAVQISLTVGYGAQTDSIPPILRHQILGEVERLYEKRHLVDQMIRPFPKRLSL